MSDIVNDKTRILFRHGEEQETYAGITITYRKYADQHPLDGYYVIALFNGKTWDNLRIHQEQIVKVGEELTQQEIEDHNLASLFEEK